MYCPDFAIYGTKTAVARSADAAKDAKAAGGEK
jgi:hypothetical protein